MNTICIILICACVALAAFEVGRRCGKTESSSTIKTVGNYNKATIGQSEKNIVVSASEVVPHATSPMARKDQLDAAKEEVAKDLGVECWLNGCIAFDYRENDLKYPPGVYKDRVWASISAEKLED